MRTQNFRMYYRNCRYYYYIFVPLPPLQHNECLSFVVLFIVLCHKWLLAPLFVKVGKPFICHTSTKSHFVKLQPIMLFFSVICFYKIVLLAFSGLQGREGESMSGFTGSLFLFTKGWTLL